VAVDIRLTTCGSDVTTQNGQRGGFASSIYTSVKAT
jgi:hypothetical protein